MPDEVVALVAFVIGLVTLVGFFMLLNRVGRGIATGGRRRPPPSRTLC